MKQRRGWEKQQNGSLTVFFALVLLLLESLFFSMVETARISALRLHGRMLLQETMESTCSEYLRILWEQYRILGIDSGYGTQTGSAEKFAQRLETLAWENITPEETPSELSMMALKPAGFSVENCRYLTDDNGGAFRMQAAAVAKEEAAASAAQTLWDQLLAIRDGRMEDYDRQACVEAGENALQQKEVGEQENAPPQSSPIAVSEENDPFAVFSKLSKEGVTGLVAGKEISDKVCDLSRAVSKRSRQEGAGEDPKNVAPQLWDPAFYQWYLLHYFGSYTDPKEAGALSYELEYIAAGKESDRENLDWVIGRLIALREPGNIMTIVSTPALMEKAGGVALFLAGATANPAVISAVRVALVAVWAFVESVLDVRALLQGKRIALVKTAADWKSDLSRLGEAFAEQTEHSDKKGGLSYNEYLGVLLMLQSEKALGLRPLDLMEESVRRQEGCGQTRLDQVICAFSATARYQGEPLFFSYMGEGLPDMKLYEVSVEGSAAY